MKRYTSLFQDKADSRKIYIQTLKPCFFIIHQQKSGKDSAKQNNGIGLFKKTKKMSMTETIFFLGL